MARTIEIQPQTFVHMLDTAVIKMTPDRYVDLGDFKEFIVQFECQTLAASAVLKLKLEMAATDTTPDPASNGGTSGWAILDSTPVSMTQVAYAGPFVWKKRYTRSTTNWAPILRWSLENATTGGTVQDFDFRILIVPLDKDCGGGCGG